MNLLNTCLGPQGFKPALWGLDEKSFPKEQKDVSTRLEPLANAIKSV